MKSYVATILLTAAITWASLTSWFPETGLEQVPFYDKWAHFVMYAALTLTAHWDWRRSGGSSSYWAVCAAFPLVWGILMEVAQATLTTWRSGDVMDALANSVGVLLGLAVGRLVVRRRRKRWL